MHMKKIRNPFDPNINRCFGCSQDNPIGLKLEFFEEEDLLVSFWDPLENLQGYPDVVHGGIQSTLMDEVASWTVYIKARTGGFTSSIEVRFKKPLLVSKGKIKVTGKLINMSRRIAEIETHIYNSEGIDCTSGIIRYFIYPEGQAQEKMGLPEYKEFFYE